MHRLIARYSKSDFYRASTWPILITGEKVTNTNEILGSSVLNVVEIAWGLADPFGDNEIKTDKYKLPFASFYRFV